MIESFTVVSWQWVQGCAGWCSGAVGLWASPIGAGVATWKWESWDTEHPPEMLAQAAQAGGGTRGYWCFLCVLVMGSIYIMDTNKNGLEVKVLYLCLYLWGKGFCLYLSSPPDWNRGYFLGNCGKEMMQGSVPGGAVVTKIWGGKGRSVSGAKTLQD